MNRLIALAFARVLPVLHLLVFGLLGVAAFTDLLNLPGEGAREIAVGLALFAAYLLFAGVTSTLVRMAEALDRMAAKSSAPPVSVESGRDAAPTVLPGRRREPALAANLAPKSSVRKEPTLAAVRIAGEREEA